MQNNLDLELHVIIEEIQKTHLEKISVIHELGIDYRTKPEICEYLDEYAKRVQKWLEAGQCEPELKKRWESVNRTLNRHFRIHFIACWLGRIFRL